MIELSFSYIITTCIIIIIMTMISTTIYLIGGGPLGILPISMSVLVAHLFLIPIDGR